MIEEGIDDARIVFVAGARQVGKTTLIRKITRPGGHRPMRELSLDDTATREAANADPAGFVAGRDGPAFIETTPLGDRLWAVPYSALWA